MIRVLVPRPVADALLPRECPHVDCEGAGDSHCWGCDGSGSLPPLLTWLVLPANWTFCGCDPCKTERADLVRAIESGERIGIEVEETAACNATTHMFAGPLGGKPACPFCTDGKVERRVLVGSVRPTEVLPVVDVLDPDFDRDDEIVVSDDDVYHRDKRIDLSLYGTPGSLVGRFAVACEDARREG